MTGYRLFPTRIGIIGLAWTEKGVSAVQLPEKDDERTRRRLLRKAPGSAECEPPAFAWDAIDRLTSLVQGTSVDLSTIPLDVETSDFHRHVYAVARTIPFGQTWTYGQVATAAGSPGAARAVGRAMATNPIPLIIPCHRVLAANGALHGFSAHGGLVTKKRLLDIERGLGDLFAA